MGGGAAPVGVRPWDGFPTAPDLVARYAERSERDLSAMAWYEAALREGKTVVAIRTRNRSTTLEVVEALRAAGGHFINHFGRAATEEFARWRGPEPNVSSLMKH